MNRHQVLTGACNSGDHCYAVGSVEGIHFTAYAAGCDIVILASDFQRVQIIPGVTHGNIKVSCIDCSTDSGKIAASYKSKVYIFEPTPLLHHESTHEEDECTIHPHKLDYQWYQTAAFEAESLINCLSWNLEGSRLITGGGVIQIWHLEHEQLDEHGGKSVKFSVGDHEDEGAKLHYYNHDEDLHPVWDCVWRIKPSAPVFFLKYSHDGLLFASAGKNDRLVKIWYEDRKVVFPAVLTRGDSLISPKKEDLHYSFVYIAHPRTVTGFSWRKTSKFMPRGSVANMLVTSCADNVCRLWVETILPDDGLIDLEQFDPSATFDPKFHTHRHKKRFMQRLKTIRTSRTKLKLKLKEVKRVIKPDKSPDSPSVTIATEDLEDSDSFICYSENDSLDSMETESVFSDRAEGQSPQETIDENVITPLSSFNSEYVTKPESPPVVLRPKKFRSLSEVKRRSGELTERKVTVKRTRFSTSHIERGGANSQFTLSPRSMFLSKTEASFSRHAIHKRKKHHKFGPETVMSMPHIDSMSGFYNVHDYHKFAIHQNGVCPTLHFHLAGSINPETDIPLLPVVNTSADIQHNFQLHWLNNKELQFTMEAETILQEMHRGTLSSGKGGDSGSDSDTHSGQEELPEVEATNKKKKRKRKKKTKSRTDELKLGNHNDSQGSIHSIGSEGTGSTPASPEVSGSVIDALDRKIEALLKDWHQSPDMLFSIHPIDGSFLVWLVDWLDEYNPYSFRQAQVSFSSRLPHAFPVADARTMASNLMLYCNYSKMDIKSAMRLTESRLSSEKIPTQPAPASGKSSPGQNDNMLIPNVLMISKHLNGSMNQWQISFSDTSKFATVVSVAHASRACGHRFRTNNAACHPVLPLLLTTSHHNVPMTDSSRENDDNDEQERKSGIEFCSELILWRVDPVGPLSKSGGIVELARINAPDISAFIDVAWVPTLLPSSTLGTFSNSPSALFVASDGASLKMYQAVIDARTLLLDSQANKREPGMSFSSNTSSGYSVDAQRPPGELLNIISVQSSARPGCIIELEPIADAEQNWQKTQLLHVFQEQLLTGSPSGSLGSLEAIVDLSNSGNFSENFYLVVLQKNKEGHGSILHMWKITISSQLGPHCNNIEVDPKRSYVPDYNIVDDDGSNPPSRSSTPEHFSNKVMAVKLCFSTAKVYMESLPLPEGVDIISAEIAAGHLSSASIYPACLAPYLLVTACSDGTLRFWRCDISSVEEVMNGHSTFSHHSELSLSTVSFEYTLEEDHIPRKPSMFTFTRSEVTDVSYNWKEWKMLTQADDSSAVYVPGKPIAVSCAYSGRVAIAYRMGAVKTMADKTKGKFINLYVAIYECESTGGSEWLLEDTIELKNISLPENNPEIDLSCIYSPNSPPSAHLEVKDDENTKPISPSASLVNMNRLTHVPSMSTIYSVKKTLSEQQNKQSVLQQKQLVQLDWVSTEDGSHILTVGVGSKILMYAQVSNDIVQSCQKTNQRDKQETGSAVKSNHGFMDAQFRRQNFVKSKSLMLTKVQEDIQWMKLRSIELTAADGLPPLPMHMSWVRGGILVVGMDNEMHVYSQWRNITKNTDVSELDFDKRTLDDASLTVYSINNMQSSKSVAKIKPSYSMPTFKHLNSLSKKGSESNLSKFNKSKSESTTSLSVIQEFGLFEAYRIANPVLPQYHPKLLMELLNSGKTRRVKAILSHLVRCISGGDVITCVDEEQDDSRLTRPRTVSVSASSPVDNPTQEPQLDYKEILSIPALPMYALLAADDDNTVAHAEVMNPTSNSTNNKDYTNLFDTAVVTDEELNVDVFSSSPDNPSVTRKRLPSSSQGLQKPSYFGPGHARLLTTHLTHTQLPGLTSLDQMYLLALADTVASTKTDFADRFEAESKADLQNAGNTAESIDDCGLRFLLAMRHHIYLIRTLPPVQRGRLRQQGLNPSSLVWAYHSESTEELLSYIPSMQKGEPTWEELKEFGAGWWITNINILKRTMEKVAKAAFQTDKDPMDAAIYYLAMKKKSVLWGLYRSLSNKKMVDFFKHDFEEDRWRKAALKNAFDLLGKQRFRHAAAFFLLAGSLNDAVEVCLNNLNDIQLALVICRLYDGEEMMPESIKGILNAQILGCDKSGDAFDSDRQHSDPFLRSMSLWSFKDFRGSLNTLLQDAKRPCKIRQSSDMENVSSLPSVFNFYNYLRTHPLLLRQRMASAETGKRRKSVIPGFTRQQTVVLDDSSVVVDKVTPLERRLFFTTAHTHYKNGCPLLALEVLSKLPPVIENASAKSVKDFAPVSSSAEIQTGTIDPFIKEEPSNSVMNKSDSVDWGKPLTNGFKEASDSMDWSTPISNKVESSGGIDWGVPSVKFDLEEPKFDISFSSDESETESEPQKQTEQEVPSLVVDKTDDKSDQPKGQQQIDIFAQQYAFIACLKVLMEEMHTLATGFEVDGGQLRFQLYIWLEKEVEVLQFLSNYGNKDQQMPSDMVSPGTNKPPDGFGIDTVVEEHILDVPSKAVRSLSVRSDSSYKPTLHEVILAEKMDFQSKLERMANRKQWLKTHQQLLRTLASYCMLQGAGGGGLASVQMELLLLLQELQQEKTQQQLLSPLPFPTTLPLLSAAIASSKTVIADPIQHIQCMTQDLLHSVIEIMSPPGVDSAINTVLTMRNLCIALSSCIYQCLCDCDSFVVSLKESNDASLEGFTSHNFTSSQAGHLMAGVQRYRRRSNSGDDIINTSPNKWPGVTSLRVLLAREKDDVAPKLNILLCESMVAVFISLLVNALAAYDCHMLYRLVAHRFNQQLWSALFGGGVKTALKLSTGSPLPADDDLAKQRMRLHMKVMGGPHIPTKERKTFKETFLPPELSMITFFMTKPFTTGSSYGEFNYDSEESISSDEDEEEDEDYDDDDDISLRPKTLNLSAVQQHTDPNSYSWCLIRYSVVKLVLNNLLSFLPFVGIELPELPVCSPLLHAVFKTLEQWLDMLLSKLDMFSGPPDDFLSCISLDIVQGQPHSKYQALLNINNTPFVDSNSTLPIKRLWFHLLRQECLKEIFLRYVFGKRKQQDSRVDMQSADSVDSRLKEPMKIIHKEQDIITAFAINQANSNCLVLSTQKEIIELDVGPVVNPPQWLEDENEMDIEHFKNPDQGITGETVDFYVVQTPSDGQSQGTSSPQTGASTPTSGVHSNMTGRQTHMGKGIHIPGITNPHFSQKILDRSRRLLRTILRRPVAGVRRIGSHPHLPHYITGSTDGSVRLYEWGHIQPLAMLRQPGTFPKVTKVMFSSQGNKCCVSDTEGDVCLWQVGLGSNFNKPIMSLKCHNKTTSDVAFVGSSSLIATGGHSSESRNVCLWDTLLPPRSSCVHAFSCHEHGCPALVYAPNHQLLISGGRKGEICIFDIRQRQLRHTFQAHDAAVRCLSIDPEEDYFVTGSAEGDVKVWALDAHQVILSFQGEHSKNTFFRNMGSASGVTQVAVSPGHQLFSCGVDGSMKFRALPERDTIVRYWS